MVRQHPQNFLANNDNLAVIFSHSHRKEFQDDSYSVSVPPPGVTPPTGRTTGESQFGQPGQPSTDSVDPATQKAIDSYRNTLLVDYQQSLDGKKNNNEVAPSLDQADRTLSEALITKDPVKISQALADDTLAFSQEIHERSLWDIGSHLAGVIDQGQGVDPIVAAAAQAVASSTMPQIGTTVPDTGTGSPNPTGAGSTPAPPTNQGEGASNSFTNNPTAEADQALGVALDSKDSDSIVSAMDREVKAFAKQYPGASIRDLSSHVLYAIGEHGDSAARDVATHELQQKIRGAIPEDSTDPSLSVLAQGD